MLKTRLPFLFLMVVLLSACAGAPGAPVARTTVPLSQLRTPTGLSQRQPGSLVTPITVAPNRTLTGIAPQQPQRTLTIAPQVTVKNATVMSSYDAEKLITAFSAQYLGLSMTINRAAGGTGDVIMPEVQKNSLSASINGAGQVAGATLTVSSNLPGMAQVAVGKGKISGDLNADITGASIGAFTVITRSTAPTIGSQALSLIRQTFPLLSNVSLVESGGSAGSFVFQANTTHQGTDWKSRQVTLITTRITAGVTPQGKEAVVWVIVGNGEFAAYK